MFLHISEASSQDIKGFLKKFTFRANLQPNVTKSPCGFDHQCDNITKLKKIKKH